MAEERTVSTAELEHLGARITTSDGEYGERLHIKNGDGEFTIEMPEMNPWRVEFCNIDGGDPELVLGVYKESPYHPEMAKRIFFYNIGEGKIIPKYRMSRLSYPMEDYILYDIDSDGFDEIIAIELMENGEYALGGYNWRNFSFERSYESKETYKEIKFTGEASAEIIIDGAKYNLYLDEEILRWK